eukprot:2601997-Rhodomonas_salina.1
MSQENGAAGSADPIAAPRDYTHLLVPADVTPELSTQEEARPELGKRRREVQPAVLQPIYDSSSFGSEAGSKTGRECAQAAKRVGELFLELHEVYGRRDFWSLTLRNSFNPPRLKEHYDTVARHLHNAIV